MINAKNLGRGGFILFTITLLLASIASATEDDDSKLLNTFHKYGITKCDSFILKNSKLEESWTYAISRHPSLKDKDFTEASITTVTGSKGDTVKETSSYIQTPSACYLQHSTIITAVGHCSDQDNIDSDVWFVKDPMNEFDYKKYENKGGVTLYAKEISVGNFTACMMEFQRRNSYTISK